MKKKKLNEAIWFDKDGKFNFKGDFENTLADYLPIDFSEGYISTRFGSTKNSTKLTPFRKSFFYKKSDAEGVELGTKRGDNYKFEFPIYSIFAAEKSKTKIVRQFKEMMKQLKDIDPEERSYKNKSAEVDFMDFIAMLICKQFHIGDAALDNEYLPIANRTNRKMPLCKTILIPETSSHNNMNVNMLRTLTNFIPFYAKDVTIIHNAFLKAEPKNVKVLIDTQNRLLPRLNELKEEEEKRNELKKNLERLQKQWEKDGKVSAHGTDKNYLRHFYGLYNLNKKEFPTTDIAEYLSQFNAKNPICILDDVCATGTTFRNCYDTLLLNGLKPDACFGLGIFKTE